MKINHSYYANKRKLRKMVYKIRKLKRQKKFYKRKFLFYDRKMKKIEQQSKIFSMLFGMLPLIGLVSAYGTLKSIEKEIFYEHG